MISENSLQISSEINQIKQFVKLTRERKEAVQTVMKSMRNSLTKVRNNRIDMKYHYYLYRIRLKLNN